MKNQYFKRAAVSAGLAVCAGVLVFGVNAAIGAPSYSPPGTGVTPTFTGLTSTGDVEIKGELSNSSGNVNVADNLTVTGKIENPSGSVKITGDLELLFEDGKPPVFSFYKADVSEIVNTFASNPVLINDDLTINGDLRGVTNLDTQIILNSVTTGGSGVPVQIGDDLRVTGTTTLKEADVNASGGGSLKIPNGAGTGWLAVDNNELATYGNDHLYINYDSGKNVLIGGGKKSNLDVDGKVTADSLDVDGKVTADSFGTYRYVVSALKSISNNNTGWVGASCKSGEIVINCSTTVYKNSDKTGEAYDVPVTGLYSTTSGNCYANFNNRSGGTRYAVMTATCLDPSL